jgi:hypothetical protein
LKHLREYKQQKQKFCGEHGSSGRAPVQAQGPEFKPHYRGKNIEDILLCFFHKKLQGKKLL